MSRLFLVLALGLALGGPQLQSWAASLFEATQAPASTDGGGLFDPNGGAGTDGGGIFDPDGGAGTDGVGMFDPDGLAGADGVGMFDPNG